MQNALKYFIYVSLMLVLLVSNIFSFIINTQNKNEIMSLKNRILSLESQNNELKKQQIDCNTKQSEIWNDYTNEQYKFKISYPDSYNNEKVAISESDIPAPYMVSFKSISTDIRIYTTNIVEPGDVKKFIYWNYYQSKVGSDDNITDSELDQFITSENINDIDFYKLEAPDEPVKYYAGKNNLIYSISFYDYYTQEKVTDKKSVPKRMLESFRFIE